MDVAVKSVIMFSPYLISSSPRNKSISAAEIMKEQIKSFVLWNSLLNQHKTMPLNRWLLNFHLIFVVYFRILSVHDHSFPQRGEFGRA